MGKKKPRKDVPYPDKNLIIHEGTEQEPVTVVFGPSVDRD